MSEANENYNKFSSFRIDYSSYYLRLAQNRWTNIIV